MEHWGCTSGYQKREWCCSLNVGQEGEGIDETLFVGGEDETLLVQKELKDINQEGECVDEMLLARSGNVQMKMRH